jgi:tryptophan-specific transport protein
MSLGSAAPLRHGVVLVAGGAVGAGMFALPIVSAGAGFMWAALGLIVVWFFTYKASLLLLDANLKFPPGASFSTIVEGSLGPAWARVNNLCITFIMFVLMYAYTTAGASILDYSLQRYGADVSVPRGTLSLIFVALIGLLVWAGSTVVSRVSALILLLMVLTFVSVVFDLSHLIESGNLLSPWSDIGYVAAAVPVFVTALACGGLVPSLVKHYKADAAKIRLCLLYGTCLSLLVYLLWLIAALGVVRRADYVAVLAAGGNTGDLVAAMIAGGASNTLGNVLTTFSHFAIMTSFLSIGLGLFDFVQDRFAFANTKKGKSKAAIITFLPPAILSFVYPYGFIAAIGWAGLAVMFSFFFVPALMYRANRMAVAKKQPKRLLIIALVLFSVVGAALKICTVFDLLPRLS